MTLLDSTSEAAVRDHEAVAARVRAFYETHPYPPPVEDLESYRTRWGDPVRRRASHHLFWPGVPFGSSRSILVAGCGTAQAARHALRDPSHRVVGIDVSETAIEATNRLKERHALHNLEVRRMALEEVGELGERFDLVVCTGVLHHTPDPDRGLAALRDIVAPGGAVHLMVYAPYGRAGVYLMQRYARLLGVEATPPEIDALTGTLREIPPSHPLRFLFEKSPDFQSREGMADALLNPRDRAYSVPEFLRLADQAGLRLGRWLRQAAYLPVCGAPLLTPHRDRLAALPPGAQWEAMELFRGTMLRHSALLRRDDEPLPAPEGDGPSDGPRGRRPVGAEPEAASPGGSGVGWHQWVPVPMPDTIRVTEGIPDSAAAVLINRNHTYTDLYLPVDARQREWVEAVDGRRTVGEILGGQVEAEAGRTFFRRLWDYDQIVFDTSHA